MAGLEPVTSAVTGQRSNQLSYIPKQCMPGYHLAGTLSPLPGALNHSLTFGTVMMPLLWTQSQLSVAALCLDKPPPMFAPSNGTGARCC